MHGCTGVCIHVHLNAFVLAYSFPAVVVCVGSVIILFRELVSVASQYVLEAGHTLREWLVGHVRLFLAALVGFSLVLVLFLLLWLLPAPYCLLVVGLCSMTLGLRLGVGLFGLVAAQAAVRVVLGVAVWVGRLQDSIPGAIGVEVGLVGFCRIGNAENSGAWPDSFHRSAFFIIANEAVVALFRFTWRTQRMALLLGRLLIGWTGKGVVLPGGGRTAVVHGSCRLTYSRKMIVGVIPWGSSHMWRIRVIHLSLGHVSAKDRKSVV